MRRKLTELTIKSLPYSNRQTDVWDTTLPRFGLRIGKRTKTFIFNDGHTRRALGRWPHTSLQDARNRAKTILLAKYMPQSSLRAPEAAKQYLEAIQSSRKPATIEVYSIYLRRFPDLPLHQLTAPKLYQALPKGKGAANLCFATFKTFLSWCVERGHLTTNPLIKRKTPHKLQSRDRLLTDDEIKLIWKESYNHNSFGAIIRLLILSGQRLNQIHSLQYTWIHDDLIDFPSSVMKGNVPHQIPLTAAFRQNLYGISHTAISLQAASGSPRDVPVASSLPHTSHTVRASSKPPAQQHNEPSGSPPISLDYSSDKTYATSSEAPSHASSSRKNSRSSDYTLNTNDKLSPHRQPSDNVPSPQNANHPPLSAYSDYNTSFLHNSTVFKTLDISHAMKKFREALELPHFTLHDFRRYFSSTMARLGVPLDITEALLAHKTGSRSPIQRVYDRYDRMDEMRAALIKYEQHLKNLGCSHHKNVND